MNNLLCQQLDELLAKSETRRHGKPESALRVSAAMLRRRTSSEVTATTVVCRAAGEDLEALESLVTDISEEYGLNASIRAQSGSVSVRFTRRLPQAP